MKTIAQHLPEFDWRVEDGEPYLEFVGPYGDRVRYSPIRPPYHEDHTVEAIRADILTLRKAVTNPHTSPMPLHRRVNFGTVVPMARQR